MVVGGSAIGLRDERAEPQENAPLVDGHVHARIDRPDQSLAHGRDADEIVAVGQGVDDGEAGGRKIEELGHRLTEGRILGNHQVVADRIAGRRPGDLRRGVINRAGGPEDTETEQPATFELFQLEGPEASIDNTG